MATLYVNGATGNDSTTYSNNDSANPWATIGRAAWGSTDRSDPNSEEAAAAGDTVLVAAGTYNASAASGETIPAGAYITGNEIIGLGETPKVALFRR